MKKIPNTPLSVLIGFVSAVLLFFPEIVTNSYLVHLAIMSLIWIMFSSSYNILLNAGQLSLSHNGFFALGAYASAVMSMRLGLSFIPSMIVGGLLSVAAGMLIGRITLKMRGSHFVLVTFAFAEIIRLSANNWVSVTNGPMGLRGIPVPEIFGYQFYDLAPLYYLGLVLTLITLYVSWRMLNGRYGRAFIALRTSEDLAEAVGINYSKYIFIALAVSCFFTGVAGSFYAHYVTLVSPDLSKFIYMINLLIMVIAGGRYTLGGPVLGAILFVVVSEALRFFEMYRMLLFGVLLIVVVTFMPSGIYPVVIDKVSKLFARLRPAR